MSTGKFLLQIMGPDHFSKLKKRYHNIKNMFYPKLTEEKIRSVITNDLGVKKGMVVFVHSATDNLNLDFPFLRLLPVLMDIVGEEGTLVFPCWQFNYRAEDYLKKNELFDAGKSPTVMGILPELARRVKGAQRSAHPFNSVVAVGKHAAEITKYHHLSEYPCDENSPFYRITNYDGKIIGIGTNTFNLSFVHCVEDIMKEKFPLKTRTDKVFEATVIDGEGKIIKVNTRAAHYQIKYRNIERYINKYIPGEICRNLKINGTKYFTANARGLFAEMESLALRGITIYTKKAAIKNKEE